MVEETETFSISLRDYLGIRLKSPSHFFRRRWPRQPRSRPRLIIEHQKKTLLVTFFFFRPPDFREKPKPRRNTFLRQRWWKTFGWKVKFLQRRLDLSCWNLSSWTFIVTCRSYCYLVFDRCSSWDRHCTNTGFSTVYTSLTSFKIQTNANMSSKRSSLAISLRT